MSRHERHFPTQLDTADRAVAAQREAQRLLGKDELAAVEGHKLIGVSPKQPRTLPLERATLTRDVQLDAVRIGAARIGGDSVLGGRTRVPVPGFHVILTCEEEHTDFERPWADEVRRRLATVVFPAIAESAVDLRVSLVIRSEKVWAQLRKGSYLGFDRLVANSLELRAGVATGELVPPVVAEQGKAALIERISKDLGAEASESKAYSDSSSDLPMLDAVGHPAAVNPDRRLKRVAKARGWPVLNLRNR